MILVEIYVPSFHQWFDFRLNGSAYIKELVEELGNMMMASRKDAMDIQELLLFDYGKRTLLPMDQTLRACKIRNGDRLLLL